MSVVRLFSKQSQPFQHCVTKKNLSNSCKCFNLMSGIFASKLFTYLCRRKALYLNILLSFLKGYSWVTRTSFSTSFTGFISFGLTTTVEHLLRFWPSPQDLSCINRKHRLVDFFRSFFIWGKKKAWVTVHVLKKKKSMNTYFTTKIQDFLQ